MPEDKPISQPISTSSRRESGRAGGTAQSGGSVAVPPAGEWLPFDPSSPDAIGAESPFQARFGGADSSPVVVVRNQFGQLLNLETRHLIEAVPSHVFVASLSAE